MFNIEFLFFISDNRLFEIANTLRTENLQLTISIEKLRCDIASGCGGTGNNTNNTALEARLLAQAEELTMLHRRRGEHAQKIVDLNNKMQELMKDLHSKESRYWKIREKFMIKKLFLFVNYLFVYLTV